MLLFLFGNRAIVVDLHSWLILKFIQICSLYFYLYTTAWNVVTFCVRVAVYTITCTLEVPQEFPMGIERRFTRKATQLLCFLKAHTALYFKMRPAKLSLCVCVCIVTYSRVLFTMELHCNCKTQHTTIKYNQQLLDHTYTSNLYGLGTLTPVQFVQQDLFWSSSNTNWPSKTSPIP
jgi:hypothetical protein